VAGRSRIASRAPRTGRASSSPDPREELAEVQRMRILAGATEVAGDFGYEGLTVAEIVSRTGVSRRTFYELFADREQCFLAAFDVALARVGAPVLAAHGSRQAWPGRIRVALAALLGALDEHPDIARLLVVETLAAGPAALGRRAEVVRALARAVDAGREQAPGARVVGPLAAEAAVGAVLAVLHERILAAPRQPLSALLGPLMSIVVMPYLGPAAAERELRRAEAQPQPGGRGPSHPNPLHGLNMRVTYRTLRVLGAIGELPGASNRAVAERAGISDQGQTSKLLARLQGLGLIENGEPARREGARFKGEANRWALTARGAQLVEAVDGRAGSRYGVEPVTGSSPAAPAPI